jgi:hypothetical protein
MAITITLQPESYKGGPILFNGCDLHYEWRIQGSMIAAYALITGEQIAIAQTQRELIARIREWMR